MCVVLIIDPNKNIPSKCAGRFQFQFVDTTESLSSYNSAVSKNNREKTISLKVINWTGRIHKKKCV
jgi:hypothetical protein